LVGDALLEYASGAITAIGAGTTLLLSGASARVAVAATLGSNSALTALASNAGSLDLENGAALTISAGFDNTSGTMKVDTTSAGGSTLTIGATFSNGGNVTIGSNALSQTTSVNAAALQNLTGAKINIVGFAAPAMLTLAGASTDAGSIEVDGAGVLALGNTLTVTGTVNLNGGTISGGSLAGAGTMSSTKLSSSTLDGVTIASGANFTAGASSILTLDNVIVSGAVQGGGSAALRFGLAGSDAMTNISGFPLVMLGNGGANDLSLTDANFVAVPSTMTAGLTENFITIDGGDSGNTIDSSALTGTNAIAAYAGPGTDTITGGAGNDAFFAGGNTSMTGNGGTNVFVFAATGVTNQITDFAASVSNEIALSNFGFALGLGNSTATPQPLPAALIGGLTAGTFTTSAQRFAYNQSTGQLLFDADGNGAASSQVVATLTGDPVVNASQLFFVA
jgi:Ca2+-binding RTX toxin-like protein